MASLLLSGEDESGWLFFSSRCSSADKRVDPKDLQMCHLAHNIVIVCREGEMKWPFGIW